jgi:hypothetical protein
MSSQKTTNYQLNKWTGDDEVIREEFNQNSDIIDTQMKASADNITSLQTTKANADDVYNKTSMDTKLATKVDKVDYTAWSHGYVKKTGGDYSFAGGTATPIPFNSLQTDQAQEWNTAANSWNFIAKSDGVWTFSPNVILTGLTASTNVYCYIAVFVDRGSGYVSERVLGQQNYYTSPAGPQVAGTTQLRLKTGDKVQFRIYSTINAIVTEHNGTFITWGKISN